MGAARNKAYGLPAVGRRDYQGRNPTGTAFLNKEWQISILHLQNGLENEYQFLLARSALLSALLRLRLRVRYNQVYLTNCTAARKLKVRKASDLLKYRMTNIYFASRTKARCP